jgi:hypothetical protein
MSSVPDRLWRIVRGHWDLAHDRVDEAQSLADAYAELTAHIRAIQPAGPVATAPEVAALPTPAKSRGRDPLAVSYELLGVSPGIDLAALDAAYEQRLAELRLDAYPPGSPQRQVSEGRRQAVEAAYEKLRDVLNPTETRFEKIEF